MSDKVDAQGPATESRPELGPAGSRLSDDAGISEASTQTFHVKPGFQFFYTLPILLALAVLVDALSAPALDKWLFFLLILALAAISVPRGWSKVTLEADRLTLNAPLRRPRSIDLRRLLAVETSPRAGAALVLRYHLDDPDSQPDEVSEAVLGLPPLQNQAALEERLRKPHGPSH